MKTKFKWIIKVQVDPSLVEDGLDLSDNDNVHDIFCRAFPYSYGHEFETKVISSPNRREIRKIQGYKD